MATLDLQVNWDDSYRVSYEFRTDILTSRSGREQRRALRTTPRKTIEYKCTLPLEELRRFNRLMASSHHLPLTAPELTRFVFAEVASPANSDHIDISEIRDWLVPGATVSLSWGSQVESREIDGIENGAVVFTQPSTYPWPAGTKIYPSLTGYLAREIKAKLVTNQLAKADVSFEVLPASESALPFDDDPTFFNGRELFLLKPNWIRDIDWTYQHEIETVDYGRGRIAKFLPIIFETSLFEATYLARNSDEAVLLERFFGRMHGQQGEFYMPTWQNDLAPRTTTFEGANTLRVIGSDTFIAYQSTTVNRAIAVILRDGRQVFAQVSAFYLVADVIGSDTLIETVEQWPFQFDPEDVLMVCWLPVWRHATDTLTMEWLTDTVAQTKLSLRSLEALSP